MAAWYDIVAEAPWLVNPSQQTGDPKAPNFLESFKQGQVDALQMQVLKDKVAESHLQLAGNIEAQKAKNQATAGTVAFGQYFNEVGGYEDGFSDPRAESGLGRLVQKYPFLPKDMFERAQDWIDRAKKAKSDETFRTSRLSIEADKAKTNLESKDLQLDITRQRLALEESRAKALEYGGSGTAIIKDTAKHREYLDKAEEAAAKGDHATARKFLEDADFLAKGYGFKGEDKTKERIDRQREKLAKAEARAKATLGKDFGTDKDFLGEKAALDAMIQESGQSQPATIKKYNPATGKFE